MNNPEERFYPPPVGCGGLLIDATRKGKYPPVGLPKKKYMERALEIWREAEDARTSTQNALVWVPARSLDSSR